METLNKKIALLISIVILAIALSSLTSAADNSTTATRALAEKCLNDSINIMSQLDKDGFNTVRINDTLKITDELLKEQIVKEKKNLTRDYTSIILSCDSLENIKLLAYEAKDGLFVLNKEYTDFKIKSQNYEINTTEVDILMKTLNQSMNDERYENVIEQISIVSNKMVEMQSSATALNSFYKATSRGIKQIVQDNLTLIIVFFVILIALLIFYKFYLKKRILQNKIARLEVEKKVLQDMIKRIQREYFEQGKMAEGEYNIRTKKFAELIRDIERQIPLLKEEIALMSVYSRTSTTEFEKKYIKRKNKA